MQDKINVLFLHSQVTFGADSSVHALIMRHLDRARFAVHVACARSDGAGVPVSLTRLREIPDVFVRPTDFAPGVRHRSRATVLRELRGTLDFPIDFVRLVGYVRRHRIRVIHGGDRPRDAVYAVVLARLTGAKSVVHVHVGWSREYSGPARWGVGNADGVFSISRYVTDTIAATGTPRERIHTVLNGIEPSRWDPSLDGAPVRREFGIPDGAPLLLSVSRLFRQKGQRELLHALARVREQFPDVRLLIVGADAWYVHGGSFTQELKALARELGVEGHVVFTGERSDVPRLMAACDVFTLPSQLEPFGLVFLEAMAMRKPVVALDNGGTPEVVEHGRSGLLAPEGDVGAMTAHIVALLRDPARRARMGEYGRSRVLDYFHARRMADDAASAYDRLLSGQRAEGASRAGHDRNDRHLRDPTGRA
jgi:glycosyltransferase involved in cell wall biosynthesis